MCLCSSLVCSHPPLYWLRCVRKFGLWLSAHEWGNILRNHFTRWPQGASCTLTSTLAMTWWSRSSFEATTVRKRRSSLGDRDNANWIRDVSCCWCHACVLPWCFSFSSSTLLIPALCNGRQAANGVFFYCLANALRERWDLGRNKAQEVIQKLTYTQHFSLILHVYVTFRDHTLPLLSLHNPNLAFHQLHSVIKECNGTESRL